MTIRELLAEGTGLLKTAPINSPSLDAALLLGEVLGLDRVGLISGGGDPVPEEKRQAFRRLLDRRRGGECTAYILGRREFRGLPFAVNPAVLVPRPETETLVEAALEQVDRRAAEPLAVLDLCTGSGAVAVSLKNERRRLQVSASDASAGALETAARNAARLVGAGEVHFIQSDLLEAIGGPFDLIVSNPPYVPGAVIDTLAPEVRGEPRLALDGGADGLDLIRRIIPAAGKRLRPGGLLLLEADPRQMPVIRELLAQAGFRHIETRRDLAGRERVIFGEKREIR